MSSDWSVDGGGTAHETFLVAAFIGARKIGEFSYDPGAHPNLGYRRNSIAYFCPHCIDIWARLIYTNSNKVVQAAECIRVSCAKHHDHWNTAGSLLAAPYGSLWEVLPFSLLLREFQIYTTTGANNDSNN